MTKEETREKIVTAIQENFTVNDDFSDTYPIELSIEEKQESHREFGEKLSTILNKVFPENSRPIFVNNCDTVEDILHNNFKFN
jgi:hypothetical protein